MISKSQLCREIDVIKDEIIAIRRDFHMNPELGMEEIRTSAVVKSILDSLGIENKYIGDTGVIGTIYGVSPEGTTIGIRADMDALPIQEEKNTPYSSRIPGRMHACGHDAHTAILLGVSKVLNKFKNNLPGNVRLIFQPAEETVGGAKRMIEEGALQNPSVAAVIGLHVEETLDTGCIGIKSGQMNAASNPFEIIINGKGCHGAYPHRGVDAVVIASHIITCIQNIISREVDPRDSAVITVGTIVGGKGPNILCDQVILQGIIRTLDQEIRLKIPGRIEEILKGIVTAMRGAYEFKISEGYPCLINDNRMVLMLKESASKHIGLNNIITLSKPSMGVEDFAYFGAYVPSVFYKLGCRNEAKGIVYPSHGPLFDIDEECISLGILVQCQLAVDFLSRKWEEN